MSSWAMKKKRSKRRNPGFERVGDILADRLVEAISPDLAEAFRTIGGMMQEQHARVESEGVYHAPRTLRVLNRFDQL
jgi:hypothetical protein